jgi:hypothetical protein
MGRRGVERAVGAEQGIAKIKPMRHAIPKQLKELELLSQKLLSSIFGV